MEIELETLGDGRNQMGSKLADIFKILVKKLFESDAFVASILLDPRINWSADDQIFNYELRDRGIVSMKKNFINFTLNLFQFSFHYRNIY